MKSVWLEAILLLGLLTLTTLAACEYLPFMTARKSPAPVEVSVTPTPSPTPTPTPEVKKQQPRKRPTRTPTPVAQGTSATSGSVITTTESVAERDDIERTIKNVEIRLSAIKRDQLNADDAADYDHIKSFVADARSALDEKDDLRARGLAEKAAGLVDQLAGRGSGP